jgi:hypothetical protein
MNAAFYFWRSARLGAHRRAPVVALVCGLLGAVALGAWTSFASSLGIVPVTAIPAILLFAGIAALLTAGNLLAAVPASIAARTRPAAILRAE